MKKKQMSHKKPYRSPKVVKHGKLREITRRNVPNVAPDAGTGSFA